MQLKASGVIDLWGHRHISRDICQGNKETTPESVTLDDLTLVILWVLGIGLGLASAVLLLESVFDFIK